MPVTLDTSCSLVVFSKKHLFKVKKQIIQSRGQIAEVAVKYLLSCCLSALDRSLEWCMCGNSFCFHRSVSAVWLNKCFPMPGNEPFL